MYLGYGLSSQTKRRRSVENIVEEIHQISKELGISRYTLMGHSIAGLYAVNYAQTYKNEMDLWESILAHLNSLGQALT